MHLLLRTADHLGRTTTTRLWCAEVPGTTDVLWAARPAERHVRHLRRRPAVNAVVDGRLLFGLAEEVPADELDAAVAVLSAASRRDGLRCWTADDLQAPARLRLFRLRATAAVDLREMDAPVAALARR